MGRGAVLSGVSSLAEAGGRTDTSIVHVLMATSYEPRGVPPGVMIHRTTILPESHVHHLTRPPRTRPGRAVVDAAQWARTDDAARLAIADAFQRRLVTWPEISDVLAVLTRARRRRLIAATASDCAGGSHSLAELEYLRLSRQAGFPEPTRQVVRTDADGVRRLLDVVYEDWRLHVEIDGAQHTDAKAWWADMKRQNALWISGGRVLRFPAWVIRERPDDVVAQVRDALRRAGWSD
jgi:hypothetical protein